ncbi:MAG: DUF721 domain-containing protein [Nitrospiraceae bacterium]|nr:DUF721 domain-containing protein [Nitrospiraceae bacterium]
MPTKIAKILEEIALRYGWEAKLSRRKIWEVWEKVVGPQVAAHAWPERFMERDTLVVVASNSVWMQQLSFQGQLFLERLNACLESKAKIKDIRFVLGDVAAVRSQWVPQKTAKKDISQKEEGLTKNALADRAKEMMAGIQDQDLRQAMMDLYVKCHRSMQDHERLAQ